MLRKKCKAIILPTTQEPKFGIFVLNKENYNLDIIKDVFQFIEYDEGKVNLYHLYILSNDKIEIGDWYITIRPIENDPLENPYFGTPSKCIDKNDEVVISNLDNDENPKHTKYTEHKHAFKIIATSDETLTLNKIPKLFNNQFIETYNRDKDVDDVVVEYLDDWDVLTKTTMLGYGDNPDKYPFTPKPFVNDDKTIVIETAKELWSKDEVTELIIKFAADRYCEDGYLHGKSPSETAIWIKKNVF